MADPTISRLILPSYLVSLLLYLVAKETVDLEMMISNWEVAIQSVRDVVGMHFSE